MNSIITRAELKEFPRVYWLSEPGFGFGEWEGNEFAVPGGQYICTLYTEEEFIWNDNIRLDDASNEKYVCEGDFPLIGRIFIENNKIIVIGVLDVFILYSEEDAYDPHKEAGTYATVSFGGAEGEDITFLSRGIPESALWKYVRLDVSSMHVRPYDTYHNYPDEGAERTREWLRQWNENPLEDSRKCLDLAVPSPMRFDEIGGGYSP